MTDYNHNDDYRYADGYILRMGSSNSVLSYIPLLAGALAVGQTWPSQYQSPSVPSYYDSYYDLGSSGSYRYYNDTFYRVNSSNNAITAIAALLTGNDITVGKAMPAGYGIYNVPYAYRDQYIDGPDAHYRYSDGYIYQIDPTTQLVRAAIQLLS